MYVHDESHFFFDGYWHCTGFARLVWGWSMALFLMGTVALYMMSFMQCVCMEAHMWASCRYTYAWVSFEWASCRYNQSQVGWHFRKLFQSWKLRARTSLLPRFSEKRRSSFELWALKELSKISSHLGLAVDVWMSYVWMSLDYMKLWMSFM